MPTSRSSSAPRILIVEDDATIALGLRMLLYHWGYDVIAVAASGEHALVLAAAEVPDLALMDVRLEGLMDGIETAAVLRIAHPVPVLFLTAQNDPVTLERIAASEAGGVMLKPVDPDHLRAKIAQLAVAGAAVATSAAE